MLLVIISGLDLIWRGNARHPRTLRSSETDPYSWNRGEEQGDAEDLEDRGPAQAGVSGQRGMEGHWAARASRGPCGHRGRGTMRGEQRWVCSTLLSQHHVFDGAFEVTQSAFLRLHF